MQVSATAIGCGAGHAATGGGAQELHATGTVGAA
jgi:hypothetical protein